MNRVLNRAAQQELLRRRKEFSNLHRLAQRIRASCFKQQLQLIDFRGPRLAGLCTRRAAKTVGVAARFLIRALTEPGYRALYLSMLHRNVQRDFYESSVVKLLRDAGFGGKLPASLPITFPNGSTIYGNGLDNQQKAMDRERGAFYHDACLDEVGFWRTDVEKVVNETLETPIAQTQGTIILISSPGDVPNTYWHKISDPNHKDHVRGWVLLQWSWKDNPYVRQNMELRLRKLVELDPEFLSSDRYKREWEGKWVILREENCFQYTRKVNCLHTQPMRNHHDPRPVDYLPGDPQDYLYGIGVDLGSRDDSSVVVGAWPIVTNKPTLFMVDTWKSPGLDALEVGEKVSDFVSRYNPSVQVVDGASLQVVETINNRFKTLLEPAQKLGKAEHIKLMNADVNRGQVQILPPAYPLLEEWDGLVWDKRLLEEKQRWEWISTKPDHLSDAALYLYWKARHFWTQPAGPDLSPQQQQEQDYLDQLERSSRVSDPGYVQMDMELDDVKDVIFGM